jgi:hypothetical protein
MSSSTSTFSFKRAARTILWLAVSLFLFDRGLAYLLIYSEVRFYHDPHYATEFREYVKGKSYSTLILGSSRTHEGIHPLYFKTILGQEAFREASSGKNPRYNLFFYDFYKKCAGIPKVVVYGIDYFIYQGDSHKEWLARFGQSLSQPAVFSSPSLLLSSRKDIEEFLNSVIARMGKGLAKGNGAPAVPEFVQNQAFTGLDPKAGEVELERPKKFETQGYARFPGKEGRYFKKLLDAWLTDGVTVVLVIIPDYRGTFDTNVGRLKAMADLKRLTRDYPNVHIYDFNRPKVFPLWKVEYFRNGGWGLTNSHLSREGAEVFDRLLLEKIKKWYSR